MKNYTAKEAAEIEGRSYAALRKQLERDAKLPQKERKYPHAVKFGSRAWSIPAKDLNLKEDK